MFELGDGGGLVAGEDIYNMILFELLFHRLDDLDGQLNLVGSVHLGFGMAAVVAVVTVVLLVFFSEIVQQVFPAAAGGLGVGGGFCQQLFHNLLFGDSLLGGEFLQFIKVFVVIESDALAFAFIASRTTCLLIVALQAFRHIIVDNEPHVWLVDAHAESNSGHNHVALFHQKGILILHTGLGIQSGMIGKCPYFIDL